MSLLDLLDKVGGGSSYSGNQVRGTMPYTGGSLGTPPKKRRPSGGATTVDDSARNSQDRGAPERFNLSNFPSGPLEEGEEAPSVPLQTLEIAGRAPGFIAERPLALADTLLEDEEGDSPIDAIGQIPGVELIGDIVGNISNFSAAIANSSTADSLRRGTLEGWSDDTSLESTLDKIAASIPAQVVGNLLDPMRLARDMVDGKAQKKPQTWGEYKEDARRKGWTAEDVQAVIDGTKQTYDFGDKQMAADPMAEMALRVGSDPFNLIFGAGAAFKAAQGAGMLGKAIKAGAVAQRLESPSVVAAQLAGGAAEAGVSVAKGATWLGLARSFGEVAGRGAKAYQKVAIGTTAAQLGLLAAEQTPLAGPLAGLFDINQRAWDNQPLSNNSAFALFTAFHFDLAHLAGKGVGKVKSGIRIAFGDDVRARMLDTLAENYHGAGKKASHAEVLEALGGKDVLDNLIVHTHSQAAFSRLMSNPVISAAMSHADSLDEWIFKNAKLADTIKSILEDEYKNGRTNGRDTAKTFKNWFTERSGIDQPRDFDWNGRQAIDHWIQYSGAATSVQQLFRERGITLGLVDDLMSEDVWNLQTRARIAGGTSKSVPISEVRSWLDRFPTLLDTDHPLHRRDAEWWGKFLGPEFDGQTVPLGKLQGKLGRLGRDAASARDLTAEMADAERVASQDEWTAPQPSDYATAGRPTITASRVRPSIARRLKLQTDDIDSVSTSRTDPAIAAFEGRVGQELKRRGFRVDDTTQALGSWDGNLQASVEIVMAEATLPEMRLAAALVGRAGEQDAVSLSIAGARMRELGVTANGYEVVLSLPDTGRESMRAVSSALSKEFPGFTLNDTTGLIRVLVRKGDEAATTAALGRVTAEIGDLYPKDALGASSIKTSVHPAYVEFIHKNKGDGNATYSEVVAAARADGDPRAGLSGELAAALAHRRADAPDAGPGVGSPDAMGPDAGDGGPAPVRYSEPAATRVGPGFAGDAKAKKGFLYHVTDPAALESIADTGLAPQSAKGLTWADGGTGRRTFFSPSPAEALPFAKTPDQPLLRVSAADAGTVRRDRIESQSYTGKRIEPSLVEVWGADGKWHRLDQWFEQTVDPEVASAAAPAQAAYQSAPTLTDPDLPPQFDPSPDTLTAGLRATGDEITAPGQVTWMAARDAEVSASIPFHRSISHMDDASKAELAAFEQNLRTHYPEYTLQKAPNAAIQMFDEGDIATRYLRDRTWLGNVLAERGPMGRVNHLLDWLTRATPNSEMGRAAKASMMNELIPHGATPAEVNHFIKALNDEAQTFTVGKFETRIFGSGRALPQQTINRIAAGDKRLGTAGVFNERVVKAIGEANFARLLDRSSNRFMRTLDERAAKGGARGALSRALGDMYGGYQKTVVGDTTRFVSKTMYPIFRFLADPRWWAMNVLEADFIAGTRYGATSSRLRGAHKATPERPSLMHQHQGAGPGLAKRLEDELLGDNNGMVWTRGHAGYISRSFDAARPGTTLDALRALPDNDPVLLGLRDVIEAQDAASGRVRTAGELVDGDYVAAIDRLLYEVDLKGGKATITDEANAILGSDEATRLMPFLQKVWERNDATHQAITQSLTGNPSRTNLERIGNSYWLYWPLSYQVKATKWLVDVMTNRFMGAKTNLAPAALYAHHVEEHRKRLATDPEYVQMFADSPTAWFTAQMLFPMTPGDIGVSLSRPVRYVGGALGVWGSYKSAEDPITAAGALLMMGPTYTAELLAKAGREFFRKPADNLAP